MKSLPQTYTGNGLVDLQLNGYAGVDFNGDPAEWTPEQFHHVREKLTRRGVLASIITFVTSEAGAVLARARAYAELVDADAELAECFPALHIEGPFLSAIDGPRGAHPKEHCRAPSDEPDLIDRVNEAAGGRVRIVTLAPDLPGAMDLTRRCAEQGICVAIGHSGATNEQIEQAVQAGAKMSTHLGNGSHQMLPRLDNYLQRQLADDRLFASFIADGHHMPMTTLKNFIRAKTLQRSILVTDAIPAAEMPPGEYNFGGAMAIVRPDGYVSKPGEANLAGSTLTLDKAVINAFLHCDLSFDQAWAMASTIPAQLIGLDAPREVTVAVSETEFVLQ